jgi:Protein of unknown function (DUF2628)
MASSWMVLEAPAGASVAEGEELVFLRDGFSFLAFLFPPLWLLSHRLWVEAAVTFAVLLGAAGVEQWGGLTVSLPIQLMASIFVGCEGNGFRIARWRRRGWNEIAVIDAANGHDAETRYVEAEDADEERRPDRQPIVPALTAPSSAVRPSVGLLLNPGH